MHAVEAFGKLRCQQPHAGGLAGAPDHPSTLTSRNNLANAYWIAGGGPPRLKLHEFVKP